MIKDSKLVVVPNAGHCVMLEKLGFVNGQIENFITDLSKAGVKFN